MGPGASALVLLLTSILAHGATVEDLYWEGEEDVSKEFLEIKKEDESLIGSHIRKIRGLFDFDIFNVGGGGSLWDTTTTTSSPPRQYDDDDSYGEPNKDDEDDIGSGSPPMERESDNNREVTIRVSFVAIEPYHEDYSNRDSEKFQQLSHDLADSVNALYDSLPGYQHASLVRIQSRISDNFSCKVTLDIATSGYYETEKITSVLRDHIRSQYRLGRTPVNDNDFNARVIDPVNGSDFLPECPIDEVSCDNGQCVLASARCNGISDCSDRSDELNCPEITTAYSRCPADQLECTDGACISMERRCDGTRDCNDGIDEENCFNENNWDSQTDEPIETTTTAEEENYGRQPDGPPPVISGLGSNPRTRGLDCDETFLCNDDFELCLEKRCDGLIDCAGGEDELNCPQIQPQPPQSRECMSYEFNCDDNRCIPSTARCDGRVDCHDRTDEEGCPPQSCGPDDFHCNNGKCIEASKRCDHVVNCASGEDEQNCQCTQMEFQCVSDGSCIEQRKVCDGTRNCADNSDEANCPETTSSGLHVCKHSGMFRCDDGKCISVLLRCDGFIDCKDRSDEKGCPCSPDQWQCDYGNCIKRSKRCDGRVDCPSDRSDERNCLAIDRFRCRDGTLILGFMRCNRQYDCPAGDYSDEKNCPCGEGDFHCGNGFCIPASKRCDRTHDCQDRSDETNCTYAVTQCMASDYICNSGECIDSNLKCNGVKDCKDGSDEAKCACNSDQYRCEDGTCIHENAICNGVMDCVPNGEDEDNCATCPAGSFDCGGGFCVSGYDRCNDIRDCPNGEDEEGCNGDCVDHCHDGRCLDASMICNQIPDCPDGYDELHCSDCDEPSDFRCADGECINASLQCNSLNDCADGSDELNCNNTIIPSQSCREGEFKCRDNSCINEHFVCDGRVDCYDSSDEENCLASYPTRPGRSPAHASHAAPCLDSEFTCYNGHCIPHSRRCDNIYDCTDFSDEQNCYHSDCLEGMWRCTSGYCINSSEVCNGYTDCDDGSDEGSYCLRTTARPDSVLPPDYRPTPTYPPIATPPAYTTHNPRENEIGNEDECELYEWRCENGPCISYTLRCDDHVDCPFDRSDELDCPPKSPLGLQLRTYPSEQTVRHRGDVVFQCRDEGLKRAPVRWVREGGKPLPRGSTDVNGRLEMFQVTSGDGGVYICQATGFLRYPGSELRVTLNVLNAPITPAPPPSSCGRDQATCGNGQCIPKSAVCDGRRDCLDNSDEDSCNQNGRCEPNQYQCTNRRCILKTWLCDSEDDCGDGSDEYNCGTSRPGEACAPVEYQCKTNNQCVPKSFHCDGMNDCQDGSDEIGCIPVYVSQPPQPSKVMLNPGDTLTLTCRAVGVPTPVIVWRLNWGHVPEKCQSTSEDGYGTLICPDMQTDDRGAYSCEAINNKGTDFAIPDAIVNVYGQPPNICPNGYFNSEATSESECIRCFCFGESRECKSADLFTYHMASPLGSGGTRLVGATVNPGGVNVESNQITDEYFYQPLRNGATVTKLNTYNANSRATPYLALPESYNGNQLTSYGGRIKYKLEPHSAGNRYTTLDLALPDIVVKGQYGTLMYSFRKDRAPSSEIYVETRLVPENWKKPSPRGPIAVSREDIMMALDNIEVILIRASLNNGGVNITDFAMESAQYINTGLGAANLVEECKCPPGYEGLSCQKCSSGYVRESSGPWLGHCRPEEVPCPAGSYGAPARGIPCQPCPCPLTNMENQFARTCTMAPDRSVICDCMAGYEGRNCERCAPGFDGNPLIPGDSCRRHVEPSCNPVGTRNVRLPDECECKNQVQGRFCDQCKDGSFFLSPDFVHGCAQCFCSGVTQQCSSSNLRRATTAVDFTSPRTYSQVKVFSSTPLGQSAISRYSIPVETSINASTALRSSSFQTPSAIYYWSLPLSFTGDKVTSYGGNLQYTIRSTTSGGASRDRNTAPDVQLISENRLTFHYFAENPNTSPDGTISVTVPFLEGKWHRPDGTEAQRQYLLLALADVKWILIKTSYWENSAVSYLVSASIDTAEPSARGPVALHVEQCDCPPGYLGTSCEDCAPGYTRGGDGFYLQHCERCQCNGHSNECHPETGECHNCADHTAGARCELCQPGYQKDFSGSCVPSGPPRVTTEYCMCDPRGMEACEDNNCVCRRNVEGVNCDRCRAGSFGLDVSNRDGCLTCYCSGLGVECHEASHYSRVPMPAPVLGSDYGGYSITDLNGNIVINDQFVPVTNESELQYVFTNPPVDELYWSLPQLPGNKVLSYGGYLSLTQRFDSTGFNDLSTPGSDVILDGGDATIFWTNPQRIRSGESLSYKVPLREDGWRVLDTGAQVDRSLFMSVLANLKRILVIATPVTEVHSIAISDVSMDSATNQFNSGVPAKGVELCLCPPGYSGTSCENCISGYYKDRRGRCVICPCNRHDCQLDSSGQVVCNCRPPYTGRDCATIGLVMELLPLVEVSETDSTYRRISVTCKYKAPEPLTIQFYYDGEEVTPYQSYNESKLESDGWHGEFTFNTTWDTRRLGNIVECHTITRNNATLGMLTTGLAQEPVTTTTSFPPRPPESSVQVVITGPTIRIQDIGGSVNFTCQAQSRFSRPVIVQWSKADGYLPQDRSYIDERTGTLIITNLQRTDSGIYICLANDGVTTGEARATLQVPGNPMTPPTATITPSYKDYYEGDRIELQCSTTGNPTPTIAWQRVGRQQPLSFSTTRYDTTFVIEYARQEDSGEYSCVASNAAGSAVRTAVVNVRPRPSWPQQRESLSISPSTPNLLEGQNTSIVCTGTVNVSPGSIGWSRQDGANLDSNIRAENGLLYIDVARLDNQGVYICQTSSPDVFPVSVLITVTARGPPPVSERPTVSVREKEVTVPTGGNVLLECEPHGNPLPRIQWSKHGGSFGPSVSQRGNTLVITDAQQSDEGYYMCEGTNPLDGSRVGNVYVMVNIERREVPRVSIWPAGEQSAHLYSEFEFVCQVMGGIPEPVVTWSRSGSRLLSSHTDIVSGNRLKFSNITVNDEGQYTCTATNVAGEASATAELRVRQRPQITLKPSNDVEVNRGEPINIECRGTGYPEPMVSIRKDSPDYSIVVPPSSGLALLRVYSSKESDEGTYSCVATSEAGTQEEPFRITVESRETTNYPGTESPGTEERPAPREFVAIDGETTRITCLNTGENYDVRWTRNDGRPLQSNAEQRNNELYIYRTSYLDAGNYECAVIDPNTGASQQVYTTYLSVVRLPHITLSPAAQTVRPGQSPTVDCIVEGDDILRVKWQPTSKPFSNRVEVRNAQLIFHQIEVEDAGQYVCFVESRLGNATATAEVVVNEDYVRPPYVSHDNEQRAHIGAMVQLSCNVTAPNVRLSWTKDGRPLPSSVRQKADGSVYIRRATKHHAGHYVCHIKDQYGRETSNYINLRIEGTRTVEPAPVLIDQPRRPFYVGENVEVLCRGRSRDMRVNWERLDRRQHVDSRTYGDGAMLVITNVQEADAGVYRCVGLDPYRQTYTDDFTLDVIPPVGNTTPYNTEYPETESPDYWTTTLVPTDSGPLPPLNRDTVIYNARLHDSVGLQCPHDLEEPVSIEWSREYIPLPQEVRTNEPTLYLERVTERDAGTYTCRVSNSRVAVEVRAVLRVTRIVPRFDGYGWLSVPTLKDTYRQFEVEVTFKPTSADGLILYSSENEGRSGDYMALALVNGVPEFTVEFGGGPVTVRGNRPLQLNAWHTVRLNRIDTSVSMAVDKSDPITVNSPRGSGLLFELNQPMYIGGVPDYGQLPFPASGFVGCVSMLILGREETNIMEDILDEENVGECDTCTPNPCVNNGVCQEARNPTGFMCLCPSGFAGLDCARTDEACRPGLCGVGRCQDTPDGYKCSCPITYTGKRCEIHQNIEYPAFSGSAYLAIGTPRTSRVFQMSMKVKAASPVSDGIIMYCAESTRGIGKFTSLAVKDGHLEFRYDLGDPSGPVILRSAHPLHAEDWTDVYISRMADTVSLKVDMSDSTSAKLPSPNTELLWETPMFVGGYDDSIVLNRNTGVAGGFNGCIKDVTLFGQSVDIVNTSIQSANVQECKYERGDVPDETNPLQLSTVCSKCRNGGYCMSPESTSCTCAPGYAGMYCEARASYSPMRPPNAASPCAARPCRNDGICRPDAYNRNYTCDCPLGYAGANCQMRLDLRESVGFNGNGYLELPAELLRHEAAAREPVVIAMLVYTVSDGVLLYQRETNAAIGTGDYLLIKIQNGFVTMEWNMGSGVTSVTVKKIFIADGQYHQIIAEFRGAEATLSVDTQSEYGNTIGFSNIMNADSNIYIGGIPEALNVDRLPGLTGCIQQIELMTMERGIVLGSVAVAGRNTQRCRDQASYRRSN